jgi:hypothetical protein
MAQVETDPVRLKEIISELTREIQKKEAMLAAKLLELREKEEMTEALNKKRVKCKTSTAGKD